MDIVKNKSLKFNGSYCFDKERIFICYGEKSDGSDSQISAIVVSNGGIENVFQSTNGCNKFNSNEITVFKSKLILISESEPLSWVDFESATSMPRVTKKTFQGPIGTFIVSYDGLMFFSAPSVATLFVTLADNCSSTFPLRLDSKVPEKLKAIKSLCCHPLKPFLFIVNSIGSIQVWTSSGLRNKLLKLTGNECDISSQEEPSDKIDADEFGGNNNNNNNNNAKGQFVLSLSLISLLKQPNDTNFPKNEVASVTSFFINSNGNLAGTVWNEKIFCIYDISASKLLSTNSSSDNNGVNLIREIQPLCTYICPNNYILSYFSFHPILPVIFILTRTNNTSTCKLLVLSLLDSKLMLIKDYNLDNTYTYPEAIHISPISTTITIITNYHSTISTTSTTSLKSVKNKKILHLSTYSLSTSLGFLLHQPITSKLSIPSDVYTDGDQLLLLPSNTDSNNNNNNHITSNPPLKWPLLLTLQQNLEYGRENTPIVVSYDIYQLYPSSNSSNSYLIANYITTLPTIITPTLYYFETSSTGNVSKNSSSRYEFSEKEDRIAFEGTFYPISIHCQHSYNSNSSNSNSSSKNDFWNAVIRGHLLASSLSTATTTIKYVPTICLVKSEENNKYTFFFGNFKDASIVPLSWISDDGNLLSLTDDNYSSLLLTLSATGDKLKLIRFPQYNNNSENASTTISTWTLPKIMSSSWPCNTDSKFRKVLVVSEVSQSCRALRVLQLPSQTNSPTIPPISLVCEELCPHLLLLPGENVVDVLWQPKSCSEKHMVWMGSDVSLVAVLTSLRVLVLQTTPELVILNSTVFSFHSSASKNSLNYSKKSSIVDDVATSISWLGACVLVSYRSGSIRYLLPAAYDTETQGCPATVPESIRIIYESLAIKTSDIARGLLCTLPVHQTSNGSIYLIGCLTDRLLYACYSDNSDGSATRTLVHSRPCSPFEPLVLGLLQIPYATRRIAYMDTESLSAYLQQASDNSRTILKQLLLNYLPTTQSPSSGSELGAITTTLITTKVITSLLAYNHPDLAAIVAGISPMPHTGGAVAVVDFPSTSWIPNGLKCYVAICCSLFDTACMEILSSCPELLELFLDPEQYVGSFPHPFSSTCKQITSAAKLLLNLGQLKLAAKLMEMTGNNAFIPFITELQKTLHSDTISSSNNRRDALVEALNLIYASLPNQVKGQNYPSNIALTSMGGSGRCISTTNTSSVKLGTLDVLPVINLNEIRELYLEQKQRSLAAGGGRGGMTSSLGLGILAADSVEDWMGRLHPELLLSSGDDNNNNSKISGGRLLYDSKQGAMDGMNSATDNYANKPVGWVEGVGEGKDWDKLVGYWRFSDILYSDDEDYYETDDTTQANFPDLSKYSHSLEVFRKQSNESTADNAGSSTSTEEERVVLVIEPTTSPVDPGEDHEKVKSLNDVIFTTMDKSKNEKSLTGELVPPVLLGMRAIVHRGGALDVGIQPCMNDSNRSKMTLEMYICRDVIRNTTATPTCFNLLQRVLHSHPSYSDTTSSSNNNNRVIVLWRLWVDEEDRLCFGIPPTTTTATTTTMAVSSIPLQIVKSEVGRLAPPSEYPQWTHIAVTLHSTTDITSQIGLYINGEKCVTGNISFPIYPESDLQSTWLEIAPNLTIGWRITEVRIWADIRSITDIETQKDNYLPLASKRKRLQFRIKGSKRLFGPPPTSYDLYAVKRKNNSSDITSTASSTIDFNNFSFDVKSPPPSASPTGGGLLKLAPTPLTAAVTTNASASTGSKLTIPATTGSTGTGLTTAAARRRAAAASGAQPIYTQKEDKIVAHIDIRSPPPFPSNPPPVPSSPPPVPSNPPPDPSNPPPVPSNPPPVPSNPPPVPSNPPPVPSNAPPAPAANTTSITSVTWPEKWQELGTPNTTGNLWSKLHSAITLADRSRSIRHKILTANKKYITATNSGIGRSTLSLLAILPQKDSNSNSNSNSEVVVASFSLQSPPASSPHIQHLPVDAFVESAIIRHKDSTSSNVTNSTSPSTLLGLLLSKPMRISLRSINNNTIPTHTTTTTNTILEIPMTVPLVFWKFLERPPISPLTSTLSSSTALAELILITPTTVFYWQPEVGKQRKPEKIFDRVDVRDPTRWADRRIRDAMILVSDDKSQWSYGLLCSSNYPNIVGKEAAVVAAGVGVIEKSPLCSLHIWQSSRSESIGLFEAEGGCLCTFPPSSTSTTSTSSTTSSQPYCVLYAEHKESSTTTTITNNTITSHLVVVMFRYKDIPTATSSTYTQTLTTGTTPQKLFTLTTENYNTNSNLEVIWHRRIPLSSATTTTYSNITTNSSNDGSSHCGFLLEPKPLSNVLIGIMSTGQVLVLDMTTGNTVINLDNCRIPEAILSYEYCYAKKEHGTRTNKLGADTEINVEEEEEEFVLIALGASSGKLMRLTVDLNNNIK